MHPRVPLLSLLLLAGLARADDLTPEKVNAAIHHGVTWLQAQQRPDGSFQVQGGNGAQGAGGLEATYPLGTTALATLTLLKCEVPPDDAGIDKAFTWMYSQPLSKTYEVSLLILAIEARFAPPHD